MKNSEIGDERLITHTSLIKDALSKLTSINGYEHRFDTSKIKDFKKYYGLIAQEVEKEFPHLINNTLKISKHDPIIYKTIDHNQFVSVMVEAIKGLNDKVDKLQEQINNNSNE